MLFLGRTQTPSHPSNPPCSLMETSKDDQLPFACNHPMSTSSRGPSWCPETQRNSIYQQHPLPWQCLRPFFLQSLAAELAELSLSWKWAPLGTWLPQPMAAFPQDRIGALPPGTLGTAAQAVLFLDINHPKSTQSLSSDDSGADSSGEFNEQHFTIAGKTLQTEMPSPSTKRQSLALTSP